ncbi:uncharacterized protein EHS24_008324 [Apiotrichum porosum]|uniref:Striatin N-terminal domain-containing protein n=1 Tax=Apiotrichum porosum TaxID=105984 RepID=A0A427XPX9_9TREE|nr:uncharacterized protein EHS24_008324 [Apiotrichum porosum]RSH80896.1 hypothetical protein EHS24_008324 [Apiotrichum porosum]
MMRQSLNQRRDYTSGYPPPLYAGPGGGNPSPLGGPLHNGQMGGMQQQQQQQQQGGQQQQMGMQQQMGGNGGPPTASDGQSNSAGAAPEMNLANVLHYLQSEWRRWERDRNEWEIERAEMRARIALLEGQRRSAENLKVDLLRRVKMLEFALRQERTKSSSAGVGRSASTSAIAVPPSRLATLKDEEKSGHDTDKEGSGSSEGGDDIADRASKPNGTHAVTKTSSIAHRPAPDTTAWKHLSGLPRDPKARARSREYLKQCLQEITYLTSPGALNPLPPRAPVSVDDASSNGGDPQPSSDRPLKSLPEQAVPSLKEQEAAKEAAAAAPAASTQPTNDPPQPSQTSSVVSSFPNGEDLTAAAPIEAPTPATPAAPVPADAPPSSPAQRTVDLPEGADSADSADAVEAAQDLDGAAPRQPLTAVYRPESKAAWREELRAAHEAAVNVPWPPRGAGGDEEQLAGLTLVEDDMKQEEADGSSDRVWTTRRTLKSHLDIVRGVAVSSAPELMLASAGDDCTVKVWALDTPAVLSSKPHASTELEPVATFRGHTAAVTAVTISAPLGVVFSASMDSTIRLWRVPARDQDPYAPFDPTSAIQTLEGHTDVVWDLVLLPTRPASNNSPKRANAVESQLVSVSADGTAKVWEDRDGRWSLQASFSDFGDGVVPTCLSVDNHDFGRVLIGLSNGLVKAFSVAAGSEVQSYGQVGAQVNAVLSHPTLPLIVTGDEEGKLRFFDTSNPAATTPPLLAHPAPITSLALSPLSPMCILSASVDCSVRLWDLQRKTSLQDLSGHRKRSDEGVTCVASHPELPIVASAGADGVVRIWGAG